MSAVVEDESPAVVEWDLLGLPSGTYSFAKASAHRLVEALGLCADGVPFLVEPVQVRVFVRDPFCAKATNGRADGEDQVRRSLSRAKAFPDAVLRYARNLSLQCLALKSLKALTVLAFLFSFAWAVAYGKVPGK